MMMMMGINVDGRNWLIYKVNIIDDDDDDDEGRKDVLEYERKQIFDIKNKVEYDTK